MMDVLMVIVTSAGAITGYELARRWFEGRKPRNRRASDPADPNAVEIPE